jgi:glycosyltransferase involved in cell wall biosynthesis
VYRARAGDRRALSVAFVIDKYPPFIGGAEFQAELLARLVAARLGPSHVFTTQPDAVSDGTAVVLHRLGTARPHRLRHPSNFGAAVGALLIHGRRFSIVHGYALSGLTCGAVLGARLRGCATVVKVCSTGPDGDVAKLRRQPAGQWLWALVRRACTFVAPSPVVVDELVADGVAPRAITVIPNALPPETPEPLPWGSKAAARAGLGLPDRATVLFVGRLSPEKGLDLLMRAWERIAPQCDATLVIVGSGPESRRLADRVGHSAHADRVRLVGPRRDVERFYRAADVLVMPSPSETFGNVTAEAMAHGLAVVTTPVGLAGHFIHHGESGVIVGIDDEHAVASAVVRLIRRPHERECLGRAARRDALAARRWRCSWRSRCSPRSPTPGHGPRDSSSRRSTCSASPASASPPSVGSGRTRDARS